MRRVIEVVVLAAGLWLAVASGAAAGTYDVYGCRLPDGSTDHCGGLESSTRSGTAARNDDVRDRRRAHRQLDSWSRRAVKGTRPGGSSTPRLTRRSRTTPFTDPVRSAQAARMSTVATSGCTTMPPIWEGGSPSRYAQHVPASRYLACSGQATPVPARALATFIERSDLRILRVFLVNSMRRARVRAGRRGPHVTIWASRVGLSDPSCTEIHTRANRAVATLRRRPSTASARSPSPRRTAAAASPSVGFVVDGQIARRSSPASRLEHLHASVRRARAVPVDA